MAEYQGNGSIMLTHTQPFAGTGDSMGERSYDFWLAIRLVSKAAYQLEGGCFMDERQAVARLKRGDIGGLEALVRQYQVQAVRAAYLITRDRAQAEDIVQAAFVRAYQRIHQFNSTHSFGPWFLRSVINDALKGVTRNRHVSLEQPDAIHDESLAERLFDPAPSPTDARETQEIREEVWEALGKLSPDQRAVVVLRYFLEYSEAEMAHALSCPPGTVKWRLHAARERLRALLRPLWHMTAGEGETTNG